jgi:hypothetical protein
MLKCFKPRIILKVLASNGCYLSLLLFILFCPSPHRSFYLSCLFSISSLPTFLHISFPVSHCAISPTRFVYICRSFLLFLPQCLFQIPIKSLLSALIEDIYFFGWVETNLPTSILSVQTSVSVVPSGGKIRMSVGKIRMSFLFLLSFSLPISPLFLPSYFSSLSPFLFLLSFSLPISPLFLPSYFSSLARRYPRPT